MKYLSFVYGNLQHFKISNRLPEFIIKRQKDLFYYMILQSNNLILIN